MKLKRIACAVLLFFALGVLPLPSINSAVSCRAMTYSDFRAKVAKVADGAKQFWQDSAADRTKLAKKAKKKWDALQKKIAKEYKKAKKQGKKGLKKFKKWRKQQEKDFWKWYKNQTSQ